MTETISKHQTPDITWLGAIGSCAFLEWNVACGHLLVGSHRCWGQQAGAPGSRLRLRLDYRRLIMGWLKKPAVSWTHMKS